MRQGDKGHVIQASRTALSEEARTSEQLDFSDNLPLLRLAQCGSEEERQEATAELLRLNAGLLRNVAGKFRDRGVDMEDLLQIGTVGMIKAIRNFDLSRGTCFSTYAVPLIFGELRRHMRDEGPLKVGRSVKTLGMALMNAGTRIRTEEGREPTVCELAAACNVSPEEAAMALDSLTPPVSLSDRAYGEDNDAEIGSLIPDEESSSEIERLCDRIALGQAVSKMSPLHRQIVILRYYRNRTQQQTADLLGLTQVKISREEKKLLAFLREEMLR